MNNILQSLLESTGGIISDANSLASNNKQTLLIILFVASGGLLMSTFVVLPVIVRVRKDKNTMLELFNKINTEDKKA